MWMQNKVLGASDVYSFFPSTGSNVKGYPMYYTWCSKISQLSASLMKLANSFSQHKYFANGLTKCQNYIKVMQNICIRHGIICCYTVPKSYWDCLQSMLVTGGKEAQNETDKREDKEKPAVHS